jgi:hypothetical protein
MSGEYLEADTSGCQVMHRVDQVSNCTQPVDEEDWLSAAVYKFSATSTSSVQCVSYWKQALLCLLVEYSSTLVQAPQKTRGIEGITNLWALVIAVTGDWLSVDKLHR